MNTTAIRIAALVAMGLAAHATAAESQALRTGPMAWPKWQARLGVTTAPMLGAGTQLQSASLLGDYYFAGPGFGSGSVGGGWRATSGLFSGSAAATLSAPTLAAQPGSAITLGARHLAAPSADGAEATALPYVGLGYTGTSLRGGWGFTADIGLMGLAPDNAPRLGRTPTVSADDLLRELRLTPVLKLGVSYRF